MKLSDKGKKFIGQWEGCKLKPYQDVRGIWTIGYGAIRDALGRPVTQNTPQLSPQGAETLFSSQLSPYVDAVNKSLKKPLNQNQFDALVSMTYNIGIAGFQKSTLLKNINAGIKPLENNFTDWARAGNSISQGLLNRRKAEYKLYTTL